MSFGILFEVTWYIFRRRLTRWQCCTDLVSALEDKAPHQSSISRCYYKYQCGQTISIQTILGAVRIAAIKKHQISAFLTETKRFALVVARKLTHVDQKIDSPTKVRFFAKRMWPNVGLHELMHSCLSARYNRCAMRNQPKAKFSCIKFFEQHIMLRIVPTQASVPKTKQYVPSNPLFRLT